MPCFRGHSVATVARRKPGAAKACRTASDLVLSIGGRHSYAPRPRTRGRGVGVRGLVKLHASKTLTPDPSPVSTRARGESRLDALSTRPSISGRLDVDPASKSVAGAGGTPEAPAQTLLSLYPTKNQPTSRCLLRTVWRTLSPAARPGLPGYLQPRPQFRHSKGGDAHRGTDPNLDPKTRQRCRRPQCQVAEVAVPAGHFSGVVEGVGLAVGMRSHSAGPFKGLAVKELGFGTVAALVALAVRRTVTRS